jgi:hypothetical protein
MPRRLDASFRYAFAAETYRLLHAFAVELRATTGVGPPAAPILLASELLLDRHGNDAAWDRFEVGAFLRAVRATLPRARAHQHKAALVAFLAFLARQGRLDEETVRRAELAPIPGWQTEPDDEAPREATLCLPAFEPASSDV